MSTVWRNFITNGCWILAKAFSGPIEAIMWFLFLSLLIWFITLTDSQIGKNPCIPGMCPAWLWCESESYSVVSNPLWPRGPYSLWDSPGQHAGVASLSLLQGIFPPQGWNPGLPRCRRILYQLSQQGGPTWSWCAILLVLVGFSLLVFCWGLTRLYSSGTSACNFCVCDIFVWFWYLGDPDLI